MMIVKYVVGNKWDRNKALPWLMLWISLGGFCFFYLVPFMVSFVYSVWDNPIHKSFCGGRNYIELFGNPYFLRGLKNTAIFMAVSVPLNIVLSLAVALGLGKMGGNARIFSLIFLIPLALPSATLAFFWGSFFGQQGTLNKCLAMLGIEGIDWLDSSYAIMAIVLIFIWKNIGYDMVLFLSGLSGIPEEYYEYADVEGAGRLWKFKNIKLVYLTPTFFLVLLITFVNSFKVFKEIYLLTGEYPPDGLYVLQHYMNNMFLSLNYSKLVSAVYILTAAIVLFMAVVFRAERKMSGNLHY